jgi:hypothetical protein
MHRKTRPYQRECHCHDEDRRGDNVRQTIFQKCFQLDNNNIVNFGPKPLPAFCGLPRIVNGPNGLNAKLSFARCRIVELSLIWPHLALDLRHRPRRIDNDGLESLARRLDFDRPLLSTCTTPLMTRRSSARSLPRTSLGKCGSIRPHCSSLSQSRSNARRMGSFHPGSMMR